MLSYTSVVKKIELAVIHLDIGRFVTVVAAGGGAVKVGADEFGADEVGIDEAGVDEAGDELAWPFTAPFV